MELRTSISSCCTNGHSTCDQCSYTMTRMHPRSQPVCPICRSEISEYHESGDRRRWHTTQPPPPTTVRMMTNVMTLVRLACTFRSNGCSYVVPMSYLTEHESLCPFTTQVRCLVVMCKWQGRYGELYEHVMAEHRYSAYDVPGNHFLMPNLTYGLRDTMRRVYLIRNSMDGNRLYWVSVARAANELNVLLTVVKVADPDVDGTRPMATRMTFRVESMRNENGRYWVCGRQKRTSRIVCWDRAQMYRAVRSLARGGNRHTCMSSLHSPPWATIAVPYANRFDVFITWTQTPQTESRAGGRGGYRGYREHDEDGAYGWYDPYRVYGGYGWYGAYGGYGDIDERLMHFYFMHL